MFSKVKQLLGHVVPGVVRPLHILWNQVIGFFFIVLAIMPIPSVIRNWGKERAGGHLLLSICFIVLMGWFGISSFWQARKISKS